MLSNKFELSFRKCFNFFNSTEAARKTMRRFKYLSFEKMINSQYQQERLTFDKEDGRIRKVTDIEKELEITGEIISETKKLKKTWKEHKMT